MLIEAQLVPGASGSFQVASVIAPRFALAAIVLAVMLRRSRPWVTRDELVQGTVCGGFSLLGIIAQNDGLRFTAASTSAFLTQFYAIMIPLWVALRHRRAPRAVVLVSSVLVLAGVAILGRFDWHALRLGRGEVETLLCSVFFMGLILWIDSPRYAANRSLQVTCVMFAVSGVVFSAWGWAAAPRWAPWHALATSGPWLVLTAALTLLCTIIAYTLMLRWQPQITATEAGLIYCFEPIFGSIFALFLPDWISRWTGIGYANEQVTANLLLGGGLITAANLLIQWKPRPPPGQTAPAAPTRPPEA